MVFSGRLWLCIVHFCTMFNGVLGSLVALVCGQCYRFGGGIVLHYILRFFRSEGGVLYYVLRCLNKKLHILWEKEQNWSRPVEAENSSFSHRMYSLRLLSYLIKTLFSLCWYWKVSDNLFNNFVSHNPWSSQKPVLQSWFFCTPIEELR